MWKRDICQVDKSWLKGRLQEGVVDSEGNVIAVFSENAEAANLVASAPELLAALDRLAFAAECRDNTSGDPCRLIQVKAELSAAASNARAAIAKATGSAA